MANTEKAELARRLGEIEAKERTDFFAQAEYVWATYLLPLLTKSRQQFPQAQSAQAPVTLTLRHRRGAYRSGLQGGGVWILRWSSYEEYTRCTGDANPETFGFRSLDELVPDANHQQVLSASLPNLGVEFAIEIAAQEHPRLATIRYACAAVQSACQALSLPGQSISAQQLSRVDWTALKTKTDLSRVTVDKVQVRAQVRALAALIEALPSGPDEAPASAPEPGGPASIAPPVGDDARPKRSSKRTKKPGQ